MDFQEKLRLAIELSIKVNGKERGAISMLAKSIGVSRQRVHMAIRNGAGFGGAGFEQKIDAFIALNK
jgi:hypothetical protein